MESECQYLADGKFLEAIKRRLPISNCAENAISAATLRIFFALCGPIFDLSCAAVGAMDAPVSLAVVFCAIFVIFSSSLHEIEKGSGGNLAVLGSVKQQNCAPHAPGGTLLRRAMTCGPSTFQILSRNRCGGSQAASDQYTWTEKRISLASSDQSLSQQNQQLNLVGGCNAVNSRDLEIGGHVRSPPPYQPSF
jgi:hypothetical protein